jgi:hypothetical protein
MKLACTQIRLCKSEIRFPGLLLQEEFSIWFAFFFFSFTVRLLRESGSDGRKVIKYCCANIVFCKFD